MPKRSVERQTAEVLAALYGKKFGGKDRGRFRISMKHLRVLTGRSRVTPKIVRNISDELYELGFVLIDLETFFVVLARPTFQSYRRVSDGCLNQLAETPQVAPPLIDEAQP